MEKRFPSIFVSHGAPSMIIEDCPTRDFLRQLGKEIGRPKAIVSVSAHWTTAEPRVTMHPQPPTLYDFSGFPEELYSLTYPAPGDPVLAKRVLTLLNNQGITGEKDMSRGYDHGAWAPLMLMYPEADIPVIQLSIQPHKGTEYHMALGKALQPLRDDGVLIIASGSATHNLRDFFGRSIDSQPPEYVKEFADWLKHSVSEGATDELLDYVNKGPHAIRNHSTPEHFLPLYVAMAGAEKGTVIHDAYTYGVISMMVLSWQ
ncbi:MAG: class III extradiol ring-cleavage dioxygenase [Desulfuromonadales bacterium]